MPKRKDPPPFTKQQELVLTAMGCCLIFFHRIEFLLARCFLFILAEKQEVDGAEMPSLLSERESRTLGQLVARLREHMHIDPEFDTVLARLVRNRNLLIHGISCRKDYDLYKKRGISKLHRLASQIVRDGREVEQVLIGCYSASLSFINWQAEQEGRPPPHKARTLAKRYEKYFFKYFDMKDSNQA